MARNCPTCGIAQFDAEESESLKLRVLAQLRKILKKNRISKDLRDTYLEGYTNGWNRHAAYMKRTY